MKITNHFNLPQPLVDSVNSDEWYEKGDCDISVTQLIGPPQIRLLTEKHNDEIEQDVTDRIFMLFGSAVHNILEKADTTGYINERRFISTVDGMRIGGQVDLIHIEDGILYDYKTTSAWSLIYEVNGKPEWEQQTNCYAWLAEQEGVEINQIKIVCILKDWSKGQAQKKFDYPKQPVVTLNIPKWDKDKADTYIKSRVQLHKTAEDTKIHPPCSPKERWAKEGKIAVMKTGRKVALKLFNENQTQQAYEMAQKNTGAYIEHRIGKSVRCQDYCPVAPHCPQWAKLQGGNTDE